MTIIYIIIGFVVGYWIASWFMKERGEVSTKQKKIEEVIKLFDTKSEITNNDVEKSLSVSDATATNYLDELERQGRITQIGKTGRHVYYKRS
jgi:Fic family protein